MRLIVFRAMTIAASRMNGYRDTFGILTRDDAQARAYQKLHRQYRRFERYVEQRLLNKPITRRTWVALYENPVPGAKFTRNGWEPCERKASRQFVAATESGARDIGIDHADRPDGWTFVDVYEVGGGKWA
jgi:hypothetical protein